MNLFVRIFQGANIPYANSFIAYYAKAFLQQLFVPFSLPQGIRKPGLNEIAEILDFYLRSEMK